MLLRVGYSEGCVTTKVKLVGRPVCEHLVIHVAQIGVPEPGVLRAEDPLVKLARLGVDG